LDWAQNNDCGAVTAPVRRGIEEVQDSWFRREPFSHLGAPDADSLPMNDPDFAKSKAARFVQVIGEGIGHIFGPERMKVERILDGYAPHPQSKI
jgi:hypothetical protein